MIFGLRFTNSISASKIATQGQRVTQLQTWVGSYLYRVISATPLDEKVIEAISNAKKTEDLTGVIITFSATDVKKS
jgi:hypothetical protein